MTVAEMQHARFVMAVETVRNKVVESSILQPAASTGSMLTRCKMIFHTTKVVSALNVTRSGKKQELDKGQFAMAMAIDVEGLVEGSSRQYRGKKIRKGSRPESREELQDFIWQEYHARHYL